MRETTKTAGCSGSARLTTTSWVGAGFFCSWVRPHQGPGPVKVHPVTLRSCSPTAISSFFSWSRRTPSGPQEAVQAGGVGAELDVEAAGLPVVRLVVGDVVRGVRHGHLVQAALHLRRPAGGEAGRRVLGLLVLAAVAALVRGDHQVAGRYADEQHDDQQGERPALRLVPRVLGGAGATSSGGPPWWGSEGVMRCPGRGGPGRTARNARSAHPAPLGPAEPAGDQPGQVGGAHHAGLGAELGAR